MKKLIPILSWLPNYKRSYLAGDLSAGLTVGIMLIPQGMAYALIAGLPMIFGLYTALIPLLVYAIFGSSKQLAVGPVAMDSLLVASGLGALKLSGISDYVSMAVFLAFFVGTLQLLLGMLRMGFLAHFLSRPVISGFTSAAALVIGFSQLKHLLGVDIEGSAQFHTLVQNSLAAISDTNSVALAIGIGGIVGILGLKKISRKIPGALIVVVASILVVHFAGLVDYGVLVAGKIPSGLPTFQAHNFTLEKLNALAPTALTVALVAFAEAISIAKAIETKNKTNHLDPNQELVALGCANMAGSFFQSYPSTGSFSRSAVNNDSGAKSGLAGIISAALVALTLLFLTPLFYNLPNAILASIVMVSVFGLVDFKFPAQLFKTQRDEFVLLLFTFLITLFMGIKEGIALGVLLSLLLMIYRTSRPHVAILARVADSNYFKNTSRFGADAIERDDLLILRFDAQLYFANQNYFRQVLFENMNAKGPTLKAVVLNAEAINYVDSSAAMMLKEAILAVQARGVQFLVAGAIGPTRDTLYSAGVTDILGAENLFVKTHEAVDFIDGKNERNALQEQIALERKNKGGH